MSYSPSLDCLNVSTTSLPFSQMTHFAPSYFNNSSRISAFNSLSSAHKNFMPEILSILFSFFVLTTSWSLTIFKSNKISKQLPLPFSLSTSIVPPIASNKFFVMAIPRPVPWILFVTLFTSLVNASKILSLKLSSIPIPLSTTKKRYLAYTEDFEDNSSNQSWMCPPDCVYLTAFDIRLLNICIKRTRSACTHSCEMFSTWISNDWYFSSIWGRKIVLICSTNSKIEKSV